MIEIVVAQDYYANSRRSYDGPVLPETLCLHMALSTCYMPFSDAIAKCLISPQSFLGHLLIHNVQNIVGCLFLGLFISWAAHASLHLNAYLDSDISIFYRLTVLHLMVGAALGFTLSIVIPSLGFTYATGIALGAASFVGPRLIRLASKVVRTFYLNAMLRTAISSQQNFYNKKFNKILFADINKKGTASHQIAFFKGYLKKGCPSDFLKMIDKDPNITKMNEKDYNKSNAENFIESTISQNPLIEFKDQKASEENFKVLYFALTKTYFILDVYEYLHYERRNKYYKKLLDYAKIYSYLSEDAKNNRDFNVKAVCTIGREHFELMQQHFKKMNQHITYDFIKKVFDTWHEELPGLQVQAQPDTADYKKQTLKIEVINDFLFYFSAKYGTKATTDYIKKHKIFMDPSLEEDRKITPNKWLYPAFTALENEDENTVRQSALKDSSNLHYANQIIIKKLLPELIEDTDFIAKIKYPDLFRAATKANNLKTEDLIKYPMNLLLCLKRLKLEIPSGIRKKMIAYSVI